MKHISVQKMNSIQGGKMASLCFFAVPIFSVTATHMPGNIGTAWSLVQACWNS
ncbi:hypothetical protein [Niabella aquatica]